MIEVIIITVLTVAQVAIHAGPTWQMDLTDVVAMVGTGLIAGIIIGALVTDTLRQKYRSR